MHHQSMYNVCSVLLLGIFLLASHGRINPVDTRDLLDDTYTLEPRYHASFAAGLFSGHDAVIDQPDILPLKPHVYPQRRTPPSRKRGSAAPATQKTLRIKKLPPTPNGICKKGRLLSGTNKILHRRTDLETLYKDVPNKHRVQVGGTTYFELDTKKGSSYTTSEFYGCTVIIVASGKGLIIGHYGEVHGNCIVLDDEAKVQKNIIDSLQLEFDLYGDKIGDKARAVLINTAPKSKGIARIKRFMDDEGISKDNIKEHVYPSSSGVEEFPGPKGKAVVEWISKEEGGAQIKIYVERNTPMYTQDFDASGDPR